MIKIEWLNFILMYNLTNGENRQILRDESVFIG